MSHFTKRIKTPWGLFTFYFNRIYSVDGIRYHISVNDKDRKVVIFQLHKVENNWVFIHPENCPEWVVKLESEYSRIIEESISMV